MRKIRVENEWRMNTVHKGYISDFLRSQNLKIKCKQVKNL